MHKRILIVGVTLFVLITLVFIGYSARTFFAEPETGVTEDTSGAGYTLGLAPTRESGATFSGVLEEVHTGCYAEGECYAKVNGSRVTILSHNNQNVVGTVVGVSKIGDLASYIGKTVTVRAERLTNGDYTLYGDASYSITVPPRSATERVQDYLRVDTPPPPSTWTHVRDGCMIGGCNKQYCVDEKETANFTSQCNADPQLACFAKAKCERQDNNRCGWTLTESIAACVLDAQRR